MASFTLPQLLFSSVLLTVMIAALITRNHFSRRLLVYKLRQIEKFLRHSEEVFFQTPGPATAAPFAFTLKKWKKDLGLMNQFFINQSGHIAHKGSEENLLYFQTMKESLDACNLEVDKLIKEGAHEHEVRDGHLRRLRKIFFRFTHDFNRFNESFNR